MFCLIGGMYELEFYVLAVSSVHPSLHRVTHDLDLRNLQELARGTDRALAEARC